MNLIGALTLIRYCLTPDASNRATTKDILRHDWLAHGPVLSIQLSSVTPTTVPPPPPPPTPPAPAPVTSSPFSLTDQQSTKDHDKVHYRSSVTPTKLNDKSLSPSNSLVELELHTSSFFDTAKLRDNHTSKAKDQQRRNRVSAIPDSTRYHTSNHSRAISSSQYPYRRPLSLTLDEKYSHSPIDYHFASTSEKPSQISSPKSTATAPTYTRRSRRTVSPTSNKTSSTYTNQDSIHSPPPPLSSNYRYTLAATPEILRRTTSPEPTKRRTTSPINPSRYVVSYDFDRTLRDLKRKPIYKYTPASPTATNEMNVVPSLLNSTTPVAPSVFTTSAIKFAPAPTRRMSPLKDHDTNLISNARSSYNHTIVPNSSSNLDDSITKSAPYTNPNSRRSLFTSYDLPSSTITTTNYRKSRLLDDNNNLISLKVHD